MLLRRRGLLFRGGLDLVLPRPPLGFSGGEVCYAFIDRIDGRIVFAEVVDGRLDVIETLEAVSPLAEAITALFDVDEELDGRAAPTEALSGQLTGEC